ncbi:Transcription elongation factor spt6, partial [Lunasporangiospora selenospora]
MSDDEERRNYSDEEGEDVRYDSDRDDSEEEEEDDEEEMQKVREGFIVDDDEEEEEDEEVVRRSKKKKRRKDTIEEDLDEDLDLVEENTGIKRPEKLKRLKKRRHEEDEEEDERSGPKKDALYKIFDDDDDDMDDDREVYDDEMDRFIDDDEEEEGDIDDRRDRREQAPVKPRVRRAPIDGLNEDVWGEWYEVFGDGEDYSYALVKENGEDSYYEKKPEPRLKDVFEPGVLAERMMTGTDEIIRIKDVPERMQLRPGIQSDRILQDDIIEEEAYWITTQLNENRRGVDQPAFQASNVSSVLKFMSKELMEVPFIETHRRDYFTRVDGQTLTELLSREDLWYIYDMDLKFRSFLERREAITALMSRMGISDEYVNDCLLRASKLEELTDVSDYINLRFSKRIDKAKAFKRPGSGGSYDTVKREQLADFIKSFGLSAREFGINVYEGSKRYFPDDVTALPEEAAQQYIKQGFASADRVVTLAMNMIAQEIAVDPHVRKAIRAKYESTACVTVTPTEKGSTVIDELHPYYPFKRLSQKYVRDFHDGQFLQILQAQSEGLVKVEIKIPEEAQYLQSLLDYFLSDNVSEVAKKWNQVRSKILTTSLKDHVFGMMERSLKEKLRIQAEEWVAKKCQMGLEEKLNIAPFTSRGMKSDRMYPPRVVAISHGAGTVKDAIQVVFVDDNSKFSDHLKLDNLRDVSLQKELVDFLDRRRPDVVAVGGFTVSTRKLLEQVEKVVSDLRDLRGDDVTVVMTNDEVARLYQNSKRAMEEHPEANVLTRYCISLARLVQNPMNEYAALGRDLINIRHHPLQHLVGEGRLQELLERALVNIINSVGVDINEVVASPYKAHMLQYICGLGPRKAQNLIKNIESDDHNGASIDKRHDLVIRELLTWKIFMNSCSFLRVRTNMNGNVLDDTRIHSEDYDLARKMAADALEIDEEGLEEYENASQYVEELMRDEGAEKLNDLLLEDYAHQLEVIQHEPKRMTLETIKVELQHPFRDPRKLFEKAPMDQVFTMLTGETDQTLKEGFIIPVLVQRIKDRTAHCRLDCGIDGVIAIQNVSDSKIGSITDVLSEGQTLQAKIVRLEKEKFFVDLTCKESELRQGDMRLRQLPVDRMFNQFEEDRARNQIQSKNQQMKKGLFVPRKVNHPLFRNMNADEAVEFLKDKHRGELVIRPSTKGADHLTITVKLADDLFKHFDILEIDKKDDFSLGKTLKIDTAKYTDLDELLVSHIESILSKMEALMSSPKYKENVSDLRLMLETQTKAKPGAAVYGFTLDRKFPGYFSLVFKLGANRPIEEWSIKVFPEHYVLKGPTKKECNDVLSISNSFKEMMMSQRNRPASSKPGQGGVSSSTSSASAGMHRNGSMGGTNGSVHHGYGAGSASSSGIGSHHYVPHHSQHQQPVAAHMASASSSSSQQPQPSGSGPQSGSGAHGWGTPWSGAPWTGAPG